MKGYDHELVTTGLRDVYVMFGHNRPLTGLGLILFSAMAVASIHLHSRRTGVSLVLLIPQQVVMLVSMSRSVGCMWFSTFADGAAYLPEFISADQIYLTAFAASHSCLIYRLYVHEWLKSCWQP